MEPDKGVTLMDPDKGVTLMDPERQKLVEHQRLLKASYGPEEQKALSIYMRDHALPELADTRVAGRVLAFDKVKGYGFIRADGTNEEVMVHRMAVRSADHLGERLNLYPGERVRYFRMVSEKGPWAAAVVLEDEYSGALGSRKRLVYYDAEFRRAVAEGFRGTPTGARRSVAAPWEPENGESAVAEEEERVGVQAELVGEEATAESGPADSILGGAVTGAPVTVNITVNPTVAPIVRLGPTGLIFVPNIPPGTERSRALYMAADQRRQFDWWQRMSKMP